MLVFRMTTFLFMVSLAPVACDVGARVSLQLRMVLPPTKCGAFSNYCKDGAPSESCKDYA